MARSRRKTSNIATTGAASEKSNKRLDRNFEVQIRIESDFGPYKHGDISRSGNAVYAPQATDEDRRRIAEEWPSGNFPLAGFVNESPSVGLVCTIYRPAAPAVRRSARIVAILQNGKRILVQREYEKGTREFTLRKAGVYREPGARGENSDTLALGIDDSTWLAFKQWYRIDQSPERWP